MAKLNMPERIRWCKTCKTKDTKGCSVYASMMELKALIQLLSAPDEMHPHIDKVGTRVLDYFAKQCKLYSD